MSSSLSLIHSAIQTAQSWCTNGASIAFVTDTSGAGHLGVELASGKTAVNWLAARMNGAAPNAGCSYTNISSGGLPFRKRGGLSAVDLFGEGDEKVISRMLAQHAAGENIDGFYQYLRSPLL